MFEKIVKRLVPCETVDNHRSLIELCWKHYLQEKCWYKKLQFTSFINIHIQKFTSFSAKNVVQQNACFLCLEILFCKISFLTFLINKDGISAEVCGKRKSGLSKWLSSQYCTNIYMFDFSFKTIHIYIYILKINSVASL